MEIAGQEPVLFKHHTAPRKDNSVKAVSAQNKATVLAKTQFVLYQSASLTTQGLLEGWNKKGKQLEITLELAFDKRHQKWALGTLNLPHD